jgi:hypothetical protein
MLRRFTGALLVLALAAAGLLLLPGCTGIVDPDAHKALLARQGRMSITVYPAYVRRRPATYDDASAERLAEFLRADGLAEATATDEHVPIPGPWHASQPTMLRESAEAFAAYLREHPGSTDYALLPEYLFGGRGVPVGIHGYVLTADGTVADVVLLNSHWSAFSDADPRTVADCTEILIGVLRDDWRPSG